MIKEPVILCVLTFPLLFAATVFADASNGKIQVSENEEGFRFTEDGADVLFYQRKHKSLDGSYRRANYIHPLFDLDGNVLTEDFPEDHAHHRGIYWAWHQVWVGDKQIGDPWLAKDFEWDVRGAKIEQCGPDAATLRVRVLWKSPHWTDGRGEQQPLVEETTAITVHNAADNARKVDFEIKLLALENQIRIGGSEDEKGYGGFSLRIRLPPDIRFVGRVGEVEPQRQSVEAGPWLDMSARFGDTDVVSGLTVLSHSSLPGYPQRWILRRRGSMQNPVYPGQHAVALSNETPLVLRYRLVIHQGHAEPTAIERWQKEYAAVGER